MRHNPFIPGDYKREPDENFIGKKMPGFYVI
jgi:hypothetical protein